GQGRHHRLALVHALRPIDQGAVVAEAAQPQHAQPLGQTRIDQRRLALAEGDPRVSVQGLGAVAEILGREDELAFDQGFPPGDGRHAATASLSGRTWSRSIRLIMRPPSTAKMPYTKDFTWSLATSGVGWMAASDSCTMSDTASTSRPTRREPTWATMMTCRSVGSPVCRPKRAPRSMIGSTTPRRLMTPFI